MKFFKTFVTFCNAIIVDNHIRFSCWTLFATSIFDKASTSRFNHKVLLSISDTTAPTLFDVPCQLYQLVYRVSSIWRSTNHNKWLDDFPAHFATFFNSVIAWENEAGVDDWSIIDSINDSCSVSSYIQVEDYGHWIPQDPAGKKRERRRILQDSPGNRRKWKQYSDRKSIGFVQVIYEDPWRKKNFKYI